MYRRSSYRRSGFKRFRRAGTYGRGYQTSSRSRMSIRVPVTETFNMAFSKPQVAVSAMNARTIEWAASASTMVGCITPGMGLPTDALVNQYGNAAHPNTGATMVRIAAGKCPAVNQKLYQVYSNLYDEVKLDGMTVALSILTPVGTAEQPSLSIATAWDRKAHENEVRPLSDYGGNMDKLAITNEQLYPAAEGNYDMVISDSYPNSYAQLIAGTNATEATAINNSVAKIFRSCKASDLIERNSFHDSRIMNFAGNANAMYDYQLFYQNTGSSSVFNPVFYFAVKRSAPPGAADTSITIQAEVNYFFTFRNPKFGGAAFDPYAAAALMNRSIAAGNAERAAAAAAAAQEEPMDANRSLRSQLGDYYHIEEEDDMDDEVVVSPETTSTMEMTSSGRSMSSKGNKKRQRVKATTTDMVIPDEQTQMGDFGKSTRMDSKTGMK